MLSIYSYKCPNDFLKDRWTHLNEKNPSFSLRSWSKRMGFRNPSPLSLMMSGQRSIPKKHIPNFIRDLDLDENEAQYFETLVDLQRAKSPDQKIRYYNQLKKISPMSKLDIVELEQFHFLQDPLHTFILEMTALKGFKADPKWIQSRLKGEYSIAQVEKALDRLLKLNLLKKIGKSLVAKSQEHITNKPDIRDQAAQNYHQKISEIAAQRVIEQDVLEREFNSFSMNIKKQDIPMAKKIIREFIKTFIENVESKPKEGEETYQLNVQFFGVTERGEMK